MAGGELMTAAPDEAGLEPFDETVDELFGSEDEDEAEQQSSSALLLTILSGIVALSAVVAFFVVFAFGLSSVQEHRNQTQLYGELRGLLDPSSTVAPWIGGTIPAGAPVALLNSAAAGLHDVVVVQGSSSSQMRNGPGHLPDSPLPGQVGDSLVIGRSSTSGAPFWGLDRLRKGDLLTVTTGQGSFHFRIEDQRVAGGPLPTIPPSGSILTLVTSTGSGLLGSITNGQLLYVDAALQGTAVVTPKGQPRTVATAEIQGKSDLAALPWVLAWLAGLVLALAASVLLISRWGWRRSWLLVAPLVLAVLWGLSTELLALVPNVS